MEERNKKLYIIGLFAGVILFIVLYNCLKYGFSNGMVNIYNNLWSYLFYAIIIGLVIAVIYFLFKEYKINVTYEIAKGIRQESRLNVPRIHNKKALGYLYLAGDESHLPVKIGKIIGYSRRQNFKLVAGDAEFQNKNEKEKVEYIEQLKKDNPDREYVLKKKFVQDENNTAEEQTSIFWKFEEDCFLIRHGISSIIVRTPPRLHTSVMGDLYLFAVSLNKISEYYYPNSLHLDFEYIDETIHNEAERWTQLWFCDSMVTLLRKASSLTKDEQKEATQGKRGIEVVKDAKKSV